MLPSKTAIKKILMESAFDPRKPGPMKVIADIRNHDYYKLRAIELIHEGRLIEAISVLAMARSA